MRALVTSLALTIAIFIGGSAAASEIESHLPALKAGGHVIVLRHTATDASQQDTTPLDFTDMTKQRQLSDAGRDAARQLGGAFAALGIPIGEVYTSRLNRAVETGALIAGKAGLAIDELTDSSAGQAGAMAAPEGGGDDVLGSALRQMASTAPAAGTNTLIITHKTNIIDAFGEAWAEIKEGEAGVFRPDAAGALVLVARVKAEDWLEAAGMGGL